MSDLHHLAAAYALDALEPDERRAFEAHLPTCEICAADVRDHRETAAHLADSLAVPPPPEVRGRVLAEIGTTRQLPAWVPDQLAARRRRRWAILATAAAVAAFALVSVAVLRGPSGDGVREVMEATDAVVRPLSASSDGSMTVIWSMSEGRAVVVGRGLAAPGDRQTYELWQLSADGAHPAGLFAPDGEGAVTEVFDHGRAEAMAAPAQAG